MVQSENNGGKPGHEMTSPRSSVAARSGLAMSTAVRGETAPAIAPLDAEFRSQLARHLHDLKNLLWPISVHAEVGPRSEEHTSELQSQ